MGGGNALIMAAETHRIMKHVEGQGDTSLAMQSSANAELQIVNFHTRQISHVKLELPVPSPEHAFAAWGVAGTPNGRHVAVLWQENAGGTSIGATYFRKIVRVYEVVPITDNRPQTSRLVSELDLKEFGGMDGRVNRRIVLTPDGNTVAFYASGKFAGYRVDNGEKKYELDFDSRSSYAVCCDPPLFAAGRFDQPDDFIIWNIQDGQEISRFKLDAPIVNSCIFA